MRHATAHKPASLILNDFKKIQQRGRIIIERKDIEICKHWQWYLVLHTVWLYSYWTATL